MKRELYQDTLKYVLNINILRFGKRVWEHLCIDGAPIRTNINYVLNNKEKINIVQALMTIQIKRSASLFKTI